MPTHLHKNNPKQWQKSWLTHIPQEIRTKIYGYCSANGFILHCNTVNNNDHRHCHPVANLSDRPKWTPAETYTILSGEQADFTKLSREDVCTRHEGEVKQESVLSRLLRTCRAVNREVSQYCMFVVVRERTFLKPARCINDAIWWTYSDLRLVDPDLKRDQIPRFAPRMVRGQDVDVPEWRVELIRELAREVVRVRGAYGQRTEAVCQRVQLYDFTGHCYGSVRRWDYKDMRVPSWIFVLEIAVFPREGQWFGIGDLAKCVVAVEIVLQVLKVGMGSEILGAGTRDMCRVYERPGCRSGERLVVFEAEGWEVVAWKEKGD